MLAHSLPYVFLTAAMPTRFKHGTVRLQNHLPKSDRFVLTIADVFGFEVRAGRPLCICVLASESRWNHPLTAVAKLRT